MMGRYECAAELTRAHRRNPRNASPQAGNHTPAGSGTGDVIDGAGRSIESPVVTVPRVVSEPYP